MKLHLHEGKSYVRVSTLLQKFSDFSQIDPAVLERKQNIGTEIHQAIHEFVKGEFAYMSPSAVGYFRSFKRWFSSLKPEFIISEERYFDDDRMITGQIDGVIRFPHEKQGVLIDFKTSAQENSASWMRQAHLYAHLMHRNGIYINDTYLFIKLDKSGEMPKVFRYKHDQFVMHEC